MTPPAFSVRKLDAAGREVWRYPAEVLERSASRIVLQAFYDRDDVEFHGLQLRRGDRFVETYYADRWYNVFAIYAAGTGAFKGWYCNIARPAAIAPDGLDCEDLALDLLVFADGRCVVLDEDEFDALSLIPEERRRALQGLEELQQMANTGAGPFARQPDRPG
jgi:protein associated with RNAse G/E